MKRRFLTAALICLAAISALAGAGELRVMSYNVWLAPTPESNDWPARRDNLVADIRATDPDLFGLQEAYKHQLDYIMAALGDYSFVGVGRDDGAEGGEYCPVLYKTAKFDLLDSGANPPTSPAKRGGTRRATVSSRGRNSAKRKAAVSWSTPTPISTISVERRAAKARN